MASTRSSTNGWRTPSSILLLAAHLPSTRTRRCFVAALTLGLAFACISPNTCRCDSIFATTSFSRVLARRMSFGSRSASRCRSGDEYEEAGAHLGDVGFACGATRHCPRGRDRDQGGAAQARPRTRALLREG